MSNLNDKLVETLKSFDDRKDNFSEITVYSAIKKVAEEHTSTEPVKNLSCHRFS